MLEQNSQTEAFATKDNMNTAETNAIEVTKLKKQFGDFVAVKEVSFTVHKGEIFGLLGPERRRQNHADSHDDNAHAANIRSSR